jgi:hypothetical protein
MNYAQLVELYFERSGALQNYWTLYVVIIGGLLAFSSMRQIPNRLTTILVTVLFLCFAYKNCGAIVDVTEQRLKILEVVKATPAEGASKSLIEPTMVGTDVAGVKKFHYFCDGLTVLTLWSMEWRRRRRQAELAGKV